MAIKTFINGQENGVITFKGDTEPCAVYVNGERQDNISYTPELIEGVNSVEYSSEYKKNIRTMQIDGNTEQYQGTFAPQNITIPTSYVTPSSAPIIVSATPITVPNGARLTLTANKTGNGNVSSLSSGFIVIISDNRDDIANNYTEILEDYGTPQYSPTPKVSGEFYIGIANFLPGGIDNPQAYWDFLRANYTFTLSTEGNTVPNPDFPQPIHNANDSGMSLELRVNGNITTIAIPPSVTVGNSTIPLRFARVEDKSDYIEVNRLDGTVKYVRNIAYGKFPHANVTHTYINMKGVYAYDFAEQTMARAKGICTHTNKVGNYVNEQAKNAIWIGVNSMVIYWVGILDTLGFTTVKEFNAWLDEQEANGTPVELIYQLKTPVTRDITNTDLGQALLNLANSTQNATNIITITSTPSVSKLSVNYAKYGGVI